MPGYLRAGDTLVVASIARLLGVSRTMLHKYLPELTDGGRAALEESPRRWTMARLVSVSPTEPGSGICESRKFPALPYRDEPLGGLGAFGSRITALEYVIRVGSVGITVGESAVSLSTTNGGHSAPATCTVSCGRMTTLKGVSNSEVVPMTRQCCHDSTR